MGFIKKINNWNALIKFIINCRTKENSLGKFKILTTTDSGSSGIRIIVIALDSDDNMVEQIELTQKTK